MTTESAHPTRFDFDGPAGRLQGRLSRVSSTAGSSPSAVIAHPHPLYGGTMDNLVVRLAEQALLEQGVTTLCFNFRGVGSSEGSHDEGRGEQEDLLAAHDALHAALVPDSGDPTPPTLWVGYSFGAAVALRRAAQRCTASATREVQGLLLLAPPLAFYDFGFVAEISLPIALVCADCDDLTPANELREASRWPSLVHSELIEGSGHDLGSTRQPDTVRCAVSRSARRLLEAGLTQPAAEGSGNGVGEIR